MATDDEAREVLRSGWGIGAVEAIEPLKSGRVWRIATADASYVLKDWGEKDTALEQRVAFYQEVMAHVEASGVPVESAVPPVGGGFIHRHGRSAWWLVRTLPNDGGPLDAAEAQELQRDYGRWIARLHRALAAYPQADARRRTWRKALRDELMTRDLPRIRQALTGDDAARFAAAVGPHLDEVATRLDGLPEQLIFYDCHHGNILRVGARVTGFVDADHLSIGQRIWDLCYLAAQGIDHIDSDGPIVWSAQVRTLIDAYHEENPLDARERRAIWHGMAGFRVSSLAASLDGPRPDLTRALLAQLERLHRVRSCFE